MYVNTDSDWDSPRVTWIYRGAIGACLLAALAATIGYMTGMLTMTTAVALCAMAGLLVAVVPPWFTGEADVWRRDWGQEGTHNAVVANIVVSILGWPLIAISVIFAAEPILVTLGATPVFTFQERLIAGALWAVAYGLGLIEKWVQSYRY